MAQSDGYAYHDDYHNSAPSGTLFEQTSKPTNYRDLIGHEAYIHRTFDAQSNAQAMLICGGSNLAAHASFDPIYQRAQNWIRHHAVGPAVLSPVLIAGLTGALIEAAFPHGVLDSQSLKQVRPLIVGVTVMSKIKVVNVEDYRQTSSGNTSQTLTDEEEQTNRTHGFKVDLETSVTRVRDDAMIAHGNYSLWIPDYLNM